MRTMEPRAEVVAMAIEVAEVVGGAVALNLLIGYPRWSP